MWEATYINGDGIDANEAMSRKNVVHKAMRKKAKR